MKRRLRICTVFVLLILLLSLFTGCNGWRNSDKFRACEQIAERVEKGRVYSKEDVIEALGRPSYFKNNTEGADYMDAEVTWWGYEESDYTGYGWRLTLTFDSNGNTISATFHAPPGG